MEKATLIYDKECPLCRRAAAWAEERARGGMIESMACGSV